MSYVDQYVINVFLYTFSYNVYKGCGCTVYYEYTSDIKDSDKRKWLY